MPFRFKFPAIHFNSRRTLFVFSIYGMLRLIFWLFAPPNPDEAYYWLWGQNPEMSYFDHPPLLAWTHWVFSHLFGHSLFVLRLPSFLATVVFFWTYFKLLDWVYRGRIQSKEHLLLGVLSCPLYFVFLSFAWHDALLLMFSILSIYSFLRFVENVLKNPKTSGMFLYASAATLGLAALSKYNALFIGLAFLAVVLTERRLRSLLLDFRTFVAVGIVVLVTLPVWVWNWENHFGSFKYHLVDRNSGAIHFQWLHLRGFLLTSALACSPFVITLWIAGVQRGLRVGVLSRITRHLMMWLFALSTGLFTLLSCFSVSLYYWNICAYLGLFLFIPGLSWISSSRQTSGATVPNWMFWGQHAFGILSISAFLFHTMAVPLTALGGKGGDADSSLLFGWHEVGAAVREQMKSIGPDSLVISTDYRTASGLAFELNRKDVISLSDRNDQFKYWWKPEEHRGQNAVILADDWHPLPDQMKERFQSFSKGSRISVRRFGIWIKDYYVYTGIGFKG